jgi:hypothetical protein
MSTLHIFIEYSSAECSIVESLAFHWEPLVALEQLAVESKLVMELMAFFVDSFHAFIDYFNEFGFNAFSCFRNFDCDFYFGRVFFLLRVFG